MEFSKNYADETVSFGEKELYIISFSYLVIAVTLTLDFVTISFDIKI